MINGHNGRDEAGRFAVGNSGGPGGSPYAKRCAQLRQALIEAVAEEDIRNIVMALVRQAKTGDVQSARLLFDRLMGKPLTPVVAEVVTGESVTLNQAIEQLRRATPEERAIVRQAGQIMRRIQREANSPN